MSRAAMSSVVAVLLASAAVSTTVTIPTEFREIVADASLIVRGHVTDVRAMAVRDRGIESVATVAVDAVLKGSVTGFVSVRVPGGAIGRYRWTMVGAPSLTVGEQALFFLKRDPGNGWRPVGLAMGIYQIQASPATGQPVVDPPLVAGRTAAVGPIVRGDSQRRLMAIAEFESLVRVVMAGQSSPSQRMPR